jgi:transcriptional regulator with GAF, ATPase, and Fis domain
MEGDLPAEVSKAAHGTAGVSAQVQTIGENLPLIEAVNEFKHSMIRKALETTVGNQTQAAKILGLQQSNFSRMMKTLRIR